jgi:hypothetical protein
LIKIHKNKVVKLSILLLVGTLVSHVANAEDPKPFTQAEIQQGMQAVKNNLNDKIEAWGKSLKSDDFERGWKGRQLKAQKKQEVCDIFQSAIDDTYKMALENKNRLSEADQKALQDRNVFITNLGFKDNTVDTKMGFNCLIR